MAHMGLQRIFCRFPPHLRAKSITVLVPRALKVLRLYFSPGSWGGRSEQGVAAVLQQQDQVPVAAPAAGSVLSQVARACLPLLSGMEMQLMQPSWTLWPC